MEKIARDLDLKWIRHTNGNGSYTWNCSHPKTKELLGVYKEEELEADTEENEIKRMKKEALKYTGVYLHKNSYVKGQERIWECRLQADGKRYYVGMFATIEEAALAYNQKITELGTNKPLNLI